MGLYVFGLTTETVLNTCRADLRRHEPLVSDTHTQCLLKPPETMRNSAVQDFQTVCPRTYIIYTHTLTSLSIDIIVRI